MKTVRCFLILLVLAQCCQGEDNPATNSPSEKSAASEPPESMRHVRQLAATDRVPVSSDAVDIRMLFEIAFDQLPDSFATRQLALPDLPEHLEAEAEQFRELFKERTWRSTSGERVRGTIIAIGKSNVTVDVNGKAISVELTRFTDPNRFLIKKMNEEARSFAEKINHAIEEGSLSLVRQSDIKKTEGLAASDPKKAEAMAVPDTERQDNKELRKTLEAIFKGPGRMEAIEWTMKSLPVDWEQEILPVGTVSTEPIRGPVENTDTTDPFWSPLHNIHNRPSAYAVLKHWIISGRKPTLPYPITLADHKKEDVLQGKGSAKDLLDLVGLPDFILCNRLHRFWHMRDADPKYVTKPPLSRLPLPDEAYFQKGQLWIYRHYLKMGDSLYPAAFFIGEDDMTYRVGADGKAVPGSSVPWDYRLRILDIYLTTARGEMNIDRFMHLTAADFLPQKQSLMSTPTSAEEMFLKLGKPDSERRSKLGLRSDLYVDCDVYTYDKLVKAEDGAGFDAVSVWIARDDFPRYVQSGEPATPRQPVVGDAGSGAAITRGSAFMRQVEAADKATFGVTYSENSVPKQFIFAGTVLAREWKGKVYGMFHESRLGEWHLNGGPGSAGESGGAESGEPTANSTAMADGSPRPSFTAGRTTSAEQPASAARIPTAASLQRKWHPPSGPISQQEFLARVRIGADIDEVIAVLGRPDDVERSNKPIDPGQTWVYRRLVIHPITQKTDWAKLYIDSTGHVNTIIWDGRYWDQGQPGVQVVPGGYTGPNTPANAAAGALEMLKGF